MEKADRNLLKKLLEIYEGPHADDSAPIWEGKDGTRVAALLRHGFLNEKAFILPQQALRAGGLPWFQNAMIYTLSDKGDLELSTTAYNRFRESKAIKIARDIMLLVAFFALDCRSESEFVAGPFTYSMSETSVIGNR